MMTGKQIGVGPPSAPDKHKHLVRLLQLGLFLSPRDDVMGDVASRPPAAASGPSLLLLRPQSISSIKPCYFVAIAGAAFLRQLQEPH